MCRGGHIYVLKEGLFKMRRYYKFFALLLICISLTGCSTGSSNLLKREHESKNDVIKFYKIDWLADVETVKQAFIKDHGKDSFKMSHGKAYEIYSDKAGTLIFFVNNSEYLLNWEIGGCNVIGIDLQFLINPSININQIKENQMYLYNAEYTLIADYDNALNLKHQLDNLYGNSIKGEKTLSYADEVWDEKNTNEEINYVWKDINGNTVEIFYHDVRGIVKNGSYFQEPAHLSLEYKCGDVYNYLEQEKLMYILEQQEKNTNGNDKL